jgi:hypothetical protein
MFLFPFHFNGSGLIMGIRKERSRLEPAYALVGRCGDGTPPRE